MSGAEHTTAGDALEAQVAERLAAVRERIDTAGGDPERVTIVAVTKTFGPAAVDAGLSCGLVDFGENYATELEEKAAEVAHDGESRPAGRSPRWHFLGAVQRNKVARLVPLVSCWQSLARESEAVAIARRCEHAGLPVPSAFVEVNLSGDPSRGGCAPDDARAVAEAARSEGLVVRGLMCVAPKGGPDVAADVFATVARLRDRIGLPELSIGMSGDLEQAVRAGSTMIRVGSTLFGPRITRGPAAGL